MDFQLLGSHLNAQNRMIKNVLHTHNIRESDSLIPNSRISYTIILRGNEILWAWRTGTLMMG